MVKWVSRLKKCFQTKDDIKTDSGECVINICCFLLSKFNSTAIRVTFGLYVIYYNFQLHVYFFNFYIIVIV